MASRCDNGLKIITSTPITVRESTLNGKAEVSKAICCYRTKLKLKTIYISPQATLACNYYPRCLSFHSFPQQHPVC